MEIDVAIPSPLPRTFTYQADEDIAPGTRVLVPFGGRKMIGVALGEAKYEERSYQLKGVQQILDQEPVYSSVLLEIALWMSRYYVHPIGEVLRTMLPVGNESVRKRRWFLTEKGRALRGSPDGEEVGLVLGKLFPKKPDLGEAVLKKKLKDFPGHSLEGLKKLRLITDQTEKDFRVRTQSEGVELCSEEKLSPEQPKVLTPSQASVFEEIKNGLVGGEASPYLLRGITGSGKTEIYLQLIEENRKQHPSREGQSLVLVPEISLTPQMTRIFEQRFPGRVAVVHSAMSDTERWAQLEKVRRKEALVLIGPRSAVFGPFVDLGLVIVDEEHDSSYKQNTGLMYNGRDVAILRGKLEGACVVLGSATPSLESYRNAKTGKFKLLELKERASGGVLPGVFVVESKPDYMKGSVIDSEGRLSQSDQYTPLDPAVVEQMQSNLQEGNQAIVLVNRRGFAYYLYSQKNNKAVQCPNCSISLTLHKGSRILRCHYCDYQKDTASVVKADPEDRFIAVGYGSEKAESYVREAVPGARVERVDSDTSQKKGAMQGALDRFRSGKTDILVGTQILAKGHDFPNVTLIVILDVDQLLELPDFRAGERTFQLIVQAAGRAGRGEKPGQVLIQSSRARHPLVQYAVRQDYLGYAERELKLRQAAMYPPFVRMMAIEFTSSNPREVSAFAGRVEAWFREVGTRHPEWSQRVRLLGPSVPTIEIVRNRHRRQILLSSASLEPLWKLGGMFMEAFRSPGGDLRVRMDVDPQSLL